ncbi:MAG TPA: transposase, partial [Flavobacteriales bacterium]
IVLDRWNAIPEHHAGARLDQLQIMPDHLHAILILDPPLGVASVGSTQGVDATREERGRRPNGPAPGSLGAIIGAFKSVTTKRINLAWGRPRGSVWQDGYYERVIRRQGGEYGRIAQYMAENPAKWH